MSALASTVAPSKPKQLAFDLPIATRRALIPMQTAMWLLDRTEDEILMLVERGKIEFAFDLRRKGAARMHLAVWRGSAVKFRIDEMPGLRPDVADLSRFYPSAGMTLEAVVADVLGDRPFHAAAQVKKMFTCNQGHVANLLADGTLAAAEQPGRPLRGPKSSPLITRESLARFLMARRTA